MKRILTLNRYILFYVAQRKKKDGSPQSSNDKLTEGNSCLISQSSLKFTGELGKGAFGVVSKGEWAPKKGSKVSTGVCVLLCNVVF